MASELIAERYRLLERHAIGGMAAVWRARDEWTGELVALKRVHPYLVAEPSARARLEREAEALRAVDHPAIVRPRELIDDPERPSLVMEFAAGRPLSDRIAEGPMDHGEAIAIATTIADALAVAHSRGIVHRDIKPANILVEDDGALHLIDFGIASLAGSLGDGLTDARSMIGTLRYAAPERLAGEPASPRSDVWGLGAVLYEMVTGRPVVTTDDPAAALATSTTPALDTHHLPPEIGTVVARALARDPEARYPDAASFRDALVSLDAPVDPEGPTATIVRPQPAVDGPWSGAIRAWRIEALAAGLAAALLLVAAVAGPSSPARVGAGDATGMNGLVPPAAPSVAPIVVATPDPTPSAHGGRGNGHGHGKGKD